MSPSMSAAASPAGPSFLPRLVEVAAEEAAFGIRHLRPEARSKHGIGIRLGSGEVEEAEVFRPALSDLALDEERSSTVRPMDVER